MNYTAIKNGEHWGRAGIYRLDPDGTVTELVGELEFCNGIGLSPDGRKLYHNASMEGTIAYEILPDGSLSEGKMLNADKDCDGLAVDSQGGVWIALTHQGLLLRVNPDGTTDRRIEIPGGHVTSVCFGGPDSRDLYLTTTSEGAPEIVAKGGVPKTRTGKVLHAKSDIPGLPVAKTRFQLRAA
jgi:sugar lactone lactonase YvrE